MLLLLVAALLIRTASTLSITPVTTTTRPMMATTAEEKSLVEQQLGYLPSNFVRVSAWKHQRSKRIDNDNKDNDEHEFELVPVAIQTYPLNGGAKRRQAKATLPAAASAAASVVQSPFPTLFWLTCPDISKAVAELEGKGFIQIFEKRLRDDPALAKRLIQCHEEYAEMRWRSLSEEDRRILSPLEGSKTVEEQPKNDGHSGQQTKDRAVSALLRMQEVMKLSGISGSIFTAEDPSNVQDGNEQGGDKNHSNSVISIPNIKCLHAHYAQFRSTFNVEGGDDTVATISNSATGLLNLAAKPAVNPVGEMIHQELIAKFPDLCL